jgi:hypothetical protein
VHVPLGRREVLVSGQLLDRPCPCSSHRQMRAEGVAKEVDAWLEGLADHALWRELYLLATRIFLAARSTIPRRARPFTPSPARASDCAREHSRFGLGRNRTRSGRSYFTAPHAVASHLPLSATSTFWLLPSDVDSA